MTPPAKVGTIRPSDPDAKPDRFEGGRFTADEDDTLRGTGASAGVASGTARVVFGPGDFDRVEPGDIVVATASNPGWLPLFAIAGGFVTDTGGVLSHAAVVAREFGVPAVVGTREGTKKIRDGRRIEIDGTTGVVRLA
jgi:pyruvate,water dikinase